MAARFAPPGAGPAHISSEPQKAQAPDKTITPGLQHRPFTDDEIKEAFETFDLDKNNFVGAREIKHILDCIGEVADYDEIDEMIRMCDNDGDGQVTYDEFKKMMTQPPPPVPEPLPPRAKAKAKRANATKRYQRQHTSQLTDQGLDAGKKKRPTLPNQAQLQQQRAMSIESLVRKLSGGMDKIKPSQIKRIFKRFQEIDLDKSGAIDYQEFYMCLEMEDNTIARQMFKVFDMDGSESIELKEFIVVLSRYTTASKSEKLKFAFMMFDEDGSGYIERNELLEMMTASFVIEGYSREELEEKADQVYDILGLPHDGAIGYEDFLKLAADKRALIYPVEESRHELGGNLSINKLFHEEQS